VLGCTVNAGTGSTGAEGARRTMNGFSQNQKNTHANAIVAGTVIRNTFWICNHE
jgi:hypothetical protein